MCMHGGLATEFLNAYASISCIYAKLVKCHFLASEFGKYLGDVASFMLQKAL